MKFTFSLKEFWLGIRINNFVSNFSNYRAYHLNLFPCFTISFTQELSVVRDYGLIVEAADKKVLKHPIQAIGNIVQVADYSHNQSKIEYVKDLNGIPTHISNYDKDFNL